MKLKHFVIPMIILFTTLTCTKENEVKISVTQYQTEVVPYKVASLGVLDTALTEDIYAGHLGETAVNLARVDSNMVSFLVPDITPGEYTLTFTVEGEELSATYHVLPSPEIENPDDVIAEMQQNLSEVSSNIINIYAGLGLEPNSQNESLIQYFENEFSSLVASATPQDRLQLAYFYEANREYFRIEQKKSYILYNDYNETPTEKFEKLSLEMKNTKVKIAAFIGIGVALFYLPEPTLLTKIGGAALVFKGISNVRVFYSLLEEVNSLNFIPNDVWISEYKISGLSFYSGIPSSYRLSGVFRSLEESDENSNIAILRNSVFDIRKFWEYWDTTKRILEKAKEFFGDSVPSLEGEPSKLDNTETEERQIVAKQDEVSLGPISNSAVSGSIIIVNGELALTFTTLATTEQSFGTTLNYSDGTFSFSEPISGTLLVNNNCGNGIIDDGEECDDGNNLSDDGCSLNCTIEQPVCGNGILEPGEECDDPTFSRGECIGDASIKFCESCRYITKTCLDLCSDGDEHVTFAYCEDNICYCEM